MNTTKHTATKHNKKEDDVYEKKNVNNCIIDGGSDGTYGLWFWFRFK